MALVTHTPAAARDIARRPVLVYALAEDPLGVACGRSSPWADPSAHRADAATIEELSSWPLLLPESDSLIRRQFDAKLRRSSAGALTVVAEAGGWRALAGYAAAGFGLALLPESVAADAALGLHWCPLPPALRPGNRLYAVTLDPPANADLAAFPEGLT